MSQTVNAVFEQGTFRVLDQSDLSLSEGEQVRLTIDTAHENPEALLDLAARTYDGLSADEIDEIEQIAFDRSNFFADRVR